MSTPADFGTFFYPGPTEVRPEVLRAMVRPMIPHRGVEAQALHRRIVTGLRHVFRTRRPVYLMTASATGMMEAAVRSAQPGPVLALVNGAFSARFARIAQLTDRRTRVLEVPWGETHPLELVEDVLAAEQFAAMTVVHAETSTGALSDIRALAALAHRHGTMCVVDSVTGIGGVPVETDEWRLDFVLTGAQKALAMPPGMSFAVASEPYILQAPSTPHRGFYLDLVEYERFAQEAQTPQTPALPQLYAADAQLEHIVAEGIEARWARHAAMLACVERWVDDSREAGVDVAILARPGERSPTVSVLRVPADTAVPALLDRVAARGFVIAAGYGRLAQTTVRIGHMGDHTVDGLAACLGALREALTD